MKREKGRVPVLATLVTFPDSKHAIGDRDNIRHRVITFLPERLIVFQNIQAPRMLPGAEAFQRTVIVLQFEPLGPAKTRITLSCTGWGNDPASEIYVRNKVKACEDLGIYGEKITPPATIGSASERR